MLTQIESRRQLIGRSPGSKAATIKTDMVLQRVDVQALPECLAFHPIRRTPREQVLVNYERRQAPHEGKSWMAALPVSAWRLLSANAGHLSGRPDLLRRQR